MQVNPIMLLPQSVLKELSAGEQKAGQPAPVDNVAGAAGKMESIVQTFAKLEKAVLQWFFEQRPELAKALAQLLSLQEQLSTRGENSSSGNNVHPNSPADMLDAKLGKILDLMKMLLISPQRETTAQINDPAKSFPVLFALVSELEKLKKEQTPETQRKIDAFVARLTKLLKDVDGQANLPADKQKAHQPKPETSSFTERTARGTETMSPKHEHLAVKNTVTGSDTDVKPMPKEAFSPAAAKAEAAAHDRDAEVMLIKTQINASGHGKVPADSENAAQGQLKNMLPGDDEVLWQTPQPGKSANPVPRSGGSNAGLFPKGEPDIGASLHTEHNTAEFISGRSIHKAAVLQQKLQEVVRQFAGELDRHEPGDKLRTVLQDMAKCIKSLQVNPEKEWANLLRYPVIYKQTLQKAVNLLQELTHTKQSDTVHKQIVALLSEITANLHVQTSVNQLRQENPAHQTMYFQIPLQIDDQIKNGEMLVVHEREQQGNKWKIVNSWYRFYLETQYMGQVQINLHAANKQLNIQFLLTEETFARIFDAQKSGLQQILAQHGYEVVDITCGVGAVAPLFLCDADGADRKCVDIMI